MLEKKSDTILARWLSGDIDPEERQLLEASENYGDYQRIVRGMERIQKPSYDGEALREKIQAQIDSPNNGRTISLRPWYYGAAASILLLCSLAFFFRDVEHSTLPGQQLAISLPDGSQMRLNANTQIKRSRFFWSRDKKVELLQGEAYFEVRKGAGFEVSTPQGSVQVLGTKFNVRSRQGHFEVACYQGKVQFTQVGSTQGTLLERGQRVSGADGTLRSGAMENPTPPWMQGESVFDNAPLKVVLLELEAQYGVSIQTSDIDMEERYTGGFVHGNLERALTTVMLPMGIQYRLGPGGTTILLSPRD